MPILSDIHDASQAAPAGEVLDIIQIPAFPLPADRPDCSCCAHRKAGRREEGAVSLSGGDEEHSREGARKSETIACSSRSAGTSFGYQNLVVDMRGFPIMRALVRRSCTTSRTRCSALAAKASRPAARPSSRDHWPARPPRPGPTDSSWKCTQPVRRAVGSHDATDPRHRTRHHPRHPEDSRDPGSAIGWRTAFQGRPNGRVPQAERWLAEPPDRRPTSDGLESPSSTNSARNRCRDSSSRLS